MPAKGTKMSDETKKKLSNAKKVTNKYDLSGEFGIGWTQNGYEFYFDKEDYELISQYCWHKHQDGYLRTCYGRKENGGNKYILMHRLIMIGYDKNLKIEVDHINGKPNDNQKENMRVTDHKSNMKNTKLYSTTTHGYNGVYYSKNEKKFKAHISKTHLGTFATLEEAIDARKKAEKLMFGEFLRDEEDIMNGTR